MTVPVEPPLALSDPPGDSESAAPGAGPAGGGEPQCATSVQVFCPSLTRFQWAAAPLTPRVFLGGGQKHFTSSSIDQNNPKRQTADPQWVPSKLGLLTRTPRVLKQQMNLNPNLKFEAHCAAPGPRRTRMSATQGRLGARSRVLFFWKALLLIRITQNGRRPTPYGAHRNVTLVPSEATASLRTECR